MFNPKFQEKHRAWFQALLTTPDPKTGKALIDEPAVFGVEIQNEDSFFFWTFDEKNIPDPQLRIIEKQFGDWLVKKYGSLDAAFAAWKNQKAKRDAPARRPRRVPSALQCLHRKIRARPGHRHVPAGGADRVLPRHLCTSCADSASKA